MTQSTNKARNLRLVEKADQLNEEVKTLALNLAIYLAKKSKDSEDLSRLEPDFIRLVNGTVKVVQELAVIINAARNQETIAWDAANLKGREDLLEMRLRSILEQCGRILQSLGPHMINRPESV
jgi:hypothetical protein